MKYDDFGAEPVKQTSWETEVTKWAAIAAIASFAFAMLDRIAPPKIIRRPKKR